MVRHIPGNGGPGAHHRPRPYPHRSHKVGVAANESIVLNNCSPFFLTIVVTGNGSSPDVDIPAQNRVTHVAEMRHLAATSYLHLFQLYKISHLNIAIKNASRPDVGKWSDYTIAPHLAAFYQGLPDGDMIAHAGGNNLGEGAYDTALTDGSASLYYGVGVN